MKRILASATTRITPWHKAAILIVTSLVIGPMAPASRAAVLSVPGFTLSQSFSIHTAGVAWSDFDDDGDVDLGMTVPDGTNTVFLNAGSALVSNAGILDTQADPHSFAWGDYDGDGLLDAAVGAGSGALYLLVYHNIGASGLINVTSSLFADHPSQIWGLGWADYDRDGDLDLLLARQGGAGSSLYQNDGGSSFTEVAGFATGTGVAWGDYDNDGWPDVYISDKNPLSGSSGHLYHNVAGTFVDVTTPTLTNMSGRSYTAEWVDFDNDGDLDLYVGNTTTPSGPASKLFRNDDGTAAGFVNWTVGSGIAADRGTGAWADFDNDGWLDLYAQHSTGNRLWRNLGDGTFSDVTSAPLNAVADGGIAWGDVNGDGYLDLAVASSTGNLSIFRNDGWTHHWLNVDLHGPGLNRFGIGARITLVTGGFRQMREVSASSSFEGQNSITAEFGLGLASTIDSLIVNWPDGTRQVVDPAPAVDQRVAVTEVGPAAVEAGPANGFALRVSGPNPFAHETSLAYDLPRAEVVRLEVYDATGRRVRALVDRLEAAGRHQVSWDGADARGGRLPVGVYLCRLVAGTNGAARRVVLMH